MFKTHTGLTHDSRGEHWQLVRLVRLSEKRSSYFYTCFKRSRSPGFTLGGDRRTAAETGGLCNLCELKYENSLLKVVLADY